MRGEGKRKGGQGQGGRGRGREGRLTLMRSWNRAADWLRPAPDFCTDSAVTNTSPK